jgi:hypothetical protein
MKFSFVLLTMAVCSTSALCSTAQTSSSVTTATEPNVKNLYLDVHRLVPGKVKYEDVVKAHAKDLAVEKNYGVNFLKFWVNEEQGLVYCLSSSPDTESIRKTHAEAHGLLPEHIYQVTNGQEAPSNNQKNFFLDIHYLGAGKVTAKDVEAAHKKDLAVQQNYGVNFINYWVDENEGVVMCLSEAKDSTSVILTHKAAHGLLPAAVTKVKQGE